LWQALLHRSGSTTEINSKPLRSMSWTTNDPTRKLMRQILGAFSDYEATMISLKLRGARQRAAAKRKDYREGRVPFGWRVVKQGDVPPGF
jgi:DNA invertase Pin-like site-specific DNA recombinase